MGSSNAPQADATMGCGGDADAPVELVGVTVRYDDTCALSDVSLCITPGERVCVLGANGSGKSTLASVICGLLAPDAGTVRLCGTTVRTDATGADFAAYAHARRKMGLVFQNPDDQLVTTVVADDVAFGPENLGVPSDEIGRRVERELARVGMGAFAGANPSRLSGGQKQRVAIAGALAMEPDVVVLDEPGALLDVRGRRGIMRVMGELAATGTTIVHVTHFMEEALTADRVVVLDAGRIALDGTPADVFTHGEALAAMGLELPFAAQLCTRLQSGGINVPFTCEGDELARGIVALLGNAQPGNASRSEDGTRTGDTPAASPASDVREGLHDAFGRSGAGASTRTGNATHEANADEGQTGGGAGDSAATHTAWGAGATGHARGGGASTRCPGVSPAGNHRLHTHAGAPIVNVAHVAYSYADEGGHGHNALADVTFNIAQGSRTAVVGHTGSGKSTLLRLLAALAAPDAGTVSIGGITTDTRRNRRLLLGRVGYVMQHPERQLFAETVAKDIAFGPRNLGLAEADVERRVRSALDLVGLAGRADASPFELSGGQRRLCAVAGVIAMRPKVIVFDEPTAGLDPRGRMRLRGIIERVNAAGTTIVEVTHSMDDAATADRVIVLSGGSVLAHGTPADVFAAHNAELLRAHGLGQPAPWVLADRLERAGVTSLGDPLTLDELADRLCDLLVPIEGDPPADRAQPKR